VLPVVAVLMLGIAVLVLTRLPGEDALRGIADGSVGVIDADGAALEYQVTTGSETQGAAAGAGSVWVIHARQGTVSRIDARGERVNTIDVGPAPTALAFGAGSLWVASGDDGIIAQVDPTANRVVQRIPAGNGLRAVAVGHGAVWAAAALDGEVARIDLRSGTTVKKIAVGGHPATLATSPGAVWVAGEESGTVARIDARTEEVVDAIAIGNAPSALVAGFGAVWAANRADGTVSRIDPRTHRVTDTIPAGRAPVALAVAEGALWIADARGAVLRLDPRTRTVTDTVHTGASPTGLAVAHGGVWVTTAAPLAAHRGGTLRVGSPPIDLDPAFGGYLPNARPVTELVYEALVAYRRADGAAGAKLVGALALDVPDRSGEGRRYVFRMRPGVRFSSGAPVRARDVRLSMERALVAAPGTIGPRFDAINGAARCRAAPRRCDLSRGIVTDERAGTVTIHLRRPDPALLENLTFVAVVPPGTPRRRLERGVPSGTGPYRVKRFAPGRRILLERNPHFRQLGRDGRPSGFADRVAVSLGDESRQIAAAEEGRLDIVAPYATITSRKLAALRTRIGSRLQSGRFAMTVLAWLNVEAPPFDDPLVRRALNLAVDRSRAVHATGGPDAGSPTCQLLPPGLPGHRPMCPFTAAASAAGAWTAPDEAQARRLVAAAGTSGTRVEVWAHPYLARVGRQIADVLDDLGFRSRVRVFDDLEQIYAAAVDPRRRPQIGLTGWIADFADPAGVIPQLVSCEAYAPRNPASTNLSRFCDHDVDAAIRRARAAPAASGAWQVVERRIAEAAPVVPLLNPRWVVVKSPRLGNVQFHPVTGMLLDQMWVR
jgi:peptide/nickel transport system substrate-binding protein